MTTSHALVPYGLIVFGVLYLVQPDIFYRWMARRDEDGNRHPIPDHNVKFMRALGMIFIVAGVVLLVRSGQL
jgi:uncharacterized membrane protein YidH (DUF202 family)